MLKPRLGYPTRLLQEALREKIRHVGTLGANGIQFDLRNEIRADDLSETGFRQFRHLLDENGLTIAPPVFPLRRSLIQQEGLEGRVAAITEALRFTARLGANVLVFPPGALPAPDAPDRPLFVEVLNDIARAADHVGVLPALTTGRESAEALSDVLRDVTAAPVGVNFDPAASAMAGHSPESAVRVFREHLHHVRVRDAVHEADDVGQEVPVGRGEVDWEALLAALAEIEYGGWLTPDRTTGSNPAQDAAMAIQYVTNVMPF